MCNDFFSRSRWDTAVTRAHGHATSSVRDCNGDLGAEVGQATANRHQLVPPRNMSTPSNLSATPTAHICILAKSVVAAAHQRHWDWDHRPVGSTWSAKVGLHTCSSEPESMRMAPRLPRLSRATPDCTLIQGVSSPADFPRLQLSVYLGTEPGHALRSGGAGRGRDENVRLGLGSSGSAADDRRGGGSASGQRGPASKTRRAASWLR